MLHIKKSFTVRKVLYKIKYLGHAILKNKSYNPKKASVLGLLR